MIMAGLAVGEAGGLLVAVGIGMGVEVAMRGGEGTVVL
jgi:hypothetical protein